MITIFEAALELQHFCDNNGWRSCLIGGIAVQRWSQSRVTRDIEITLLTGFDQEPPFIEARLFSHTMLHALPTPLSLRSGQEFSF